MKLSFVTSKEMWEEKIAETNGKIPYHELQEAAYEFMKNYAKDVIKAFKNGK